MARARLLHHNPGLAFFDEATSTVSEDLDCAMYNGARGEGDHAGQCGAQGGSEAVPPEGAQFGEM